MKPKTKSIARRSRATAPVLPRITIDDLIAAIDLAAGLRAKAAAPPPASVSPKSSPSAESSPILWHFQHTHPSLPNSILNLCTVAPTVAEARGKAYLLAENFTQNVIGFLKANAPTQLPGA